MTLPEEIHSAFFIEIPGLPVRYDLNLYSPEWFVQIAAGRLFPVRYEPGYFASVRGEYSPNDTILLLVNSGFKVEAISEDKQYFLVTRPKTYGYTYGDLTCVFIRDESGHYEELRFDITQSEDSLHDLHAIYAVESAIEHI